MFEDEVLTTMHLFRTLTCSKNMRCDRAVMTLFPSGSSHMQKQEWWTQRNLVLPQLTDALASTTRSPYSSPHHVSGHSCTQANLHGMFVEKSWRVDLLQIHRTSPSKSPQDPPPIPCGAFLKMRSVSTQDPSSFRSLWPCFHWSKAIQLHYNWKVGYQHSTQWRRWFVPYPQHSCSQLLKEEQEHPHLRSSVLLSKQNRPKQELSKLYSQIPPPDLGEEFLLQTWERLCALPRCWHLLRSSLTLVFAWVPNVFHVVFLAALSFSPESQACSFFVVCTDLDLPDTAASIATSCCSSGAGWAPGPLHLLLACELANIRGHRDHAPVALQLFLDTRLCEAFRFSCEQRCQNELHTQLSTVPFRVCPHYVAPTWHQKKTDNLRRLEQPLQRWRLFRR